MTEQELNEVAIHIAAQAFYSETEKRLIVHSLLNGIGADWNAEDVIRLIRMDGVLVRWDGWWPLTHHLRVTVLPGIAGNGEGRNLIYYFDVRRPE